MVSVVVGAGRHGFLHNILECLLKGSKPLFNIPTGVLHIMEHIPQYCDFGMCYKLFQSKVFEFRLEVHFMIFECFLL